FQCLQNTRPQLFLIKRLAATILLDLAGHEQLGRLIGCEALRTGYALSAPARLITARHQAGIDHLGIRRTTKRTMHEDPLVGFGRLPPPFRWAGSPGFSSDYKALAFINGKALAQLLNLGFDRCNGLFVIQVAEDVANPTRQLTALGFLEATGGYRRRTDPQTGSDERRTRIVRHAVLVHRDVGPAQSGIRIFTGNVLLDQGQQEQVVLSTAGYHI